MFAFPAWAENSFCVAMRIPLIVIISFMIVIYWFGIIPAGDVLFLLRYVSIDDLEPVSGRAPCGRSLHVFQREVIPRATSVGSVQGHDTVIPCAFLLFRNSSAFTQAHEYKEPYHRDVERAMNGWAIMFNIPETKTAVSFSTYSG